MLLILAKLAGLGILLAPMVAGSICLARRRWAGLAASEALLAGLLGVPVLLIIEVVALGGAPGARPLDCLLYVQLGISLLGAAVTIRFRSELATWGREIGSAARGAFGHRTHVTAISFAAAVIALGISTLQGVWNTPSAWDEMTYHLPQALQAYQDGRLGEVSSELIWVDAYPRGAALLYFWTLQLARTDAGVHVVNAAFALLFCVAVYVAGRRVGLPRAAALLAASLASSTPLVLLLMTIGYIDLPVGAALATALAAALPERDGAWGWRSVIIMLTACVLALWMKLPAAPIIAFLLSWRGVALISQWWLTRRHADRPRRVAVWAFGIAAIVAMLAASPPYLRAWLKYGSPVYPVRLAIGNHVLIDGVVSIEGSGAHEGWKLPLLKRYEFYWMVWYAPLGADSPGGFGPLFAHWLLGSVLLIGLIALWRREWHWLLLVASFWLVLLLPGFHTPRYALYILLPATLCAVRIWHWLSTHHWQRSGRLARVFTAQRLALLTAGALLFLQGANYYIYFSQAMKDVRAQLNSGLADFGPHRNRPHIVEYARQEHSLNGATRRAIYASMSPGETLATAVHGFQALFYDADYSYRVEHRPARPWPPGHDHAEQPKFGEENSAAWLATLQRDGIAEVVVYRGSAEDMSLRRVDSGYAPIHVQPASDDTPAIIVYRRDSGDLRRHAETDSPTTP